MDNISKDKQKIGEKAWKDCRVFLKQFGWNIQQIDWLGERNDEWIKFEVKAQEPFVPPPFKGHGLPRWQVKSSQNLLKDKNIRTYLVIYDLLEERWIGQFIDVLEKGQYKDTYGKKPRRIYPIEQFELIGESIIC